MWSRRFRAAMVCAALWALVAGCTSAGDDVVEPRGPNALEWAPERWRDILGGDDEWTDTRVERLDAPSESNLDAQLYATARTVAADAVVDDLSAGERSRERHRWWHLSTSPSDASCSTVDVASVGVVAVPPDVASGPPTGGAGDGQWIKAAVAWRGDCEVFDVATTDEVPQISFVMLWSSGPLVVPVRDWFVPGVDVTEGERVGGTPDWSLRQLSACGHPANADHRARVEVAAAWEQLCADAAAAGVDLVVTSTYRDPHEQASLVDAAIDAYGEDNANRYVAEAAGDDCASRHCAGAAIDVADRAAANGWLFAPVVCPDRILAAPGTCPSGATPEPRIAAYGFAAPLPTSPQHLEYVAPLAALDPAGSCTPPSQLSVAEMVAAVFRCRLSGAGYSTDTVERAVAEALVVSRCESGWNPNLVSFGGRFTDDPNPVDDLTYDAAGVFPFDPATAALWVPGGPSAVRDPLANIHGAASVWLAERSFGAWGCAPTSDEDLPAWAWSF